jgi:hypothetical protein
MNDELNEFSSSFIVHRSSFSRESEMPSEVSKSPRISAKRSAFWFFLLLALAGSFAVIVPILFNLRQQLQPEQLDAARQRWKERGPRDYDLLFQVKQNREPQPEEYKVIVGDGKVAMVFANQEVWLAREFVTPLGGAIGPGIRAYAKDVVPERELSGYTVEGLFHRIEQDLRKSATSGGGNFATASFDTRDGHPIRYIYRVKHTSERLEWNVRLVRP